MAEIREIFETVRTYCGMIFLDAKRPRGEEDKSVSEAARKLGSGATHVALSDKSRKSAFTLDESFTHVAHCDKFRRAAFTLAEVLITLGIIGVVAALTLPTLIQNHQKQVYVTQLKKAYSNISNALSQVVNDEGVVDWDQACIVTTTYDYQEKTNINACLHKVAKQMKALNIKDYGVTCSDDWCKYGYDVDNDISTSTTLANDATGMFTTPDGMLYMFPCWNLTNVVVDVNSISKSPNQPGRDIFEFYAAGESKVDSSGNWSYEYKNALSPVGSGSSNGCSATHLSTGCTAKVLIEGKMNY